MLARSKLMQCFTCKHNIVCWGLEESIPLGRNEKELFPLNQSVLDSFKNLESEKVNLGEYFGIFAIDCLKTLNCKQIVNRRDIFNLVFLLAALSNSSSDMWVCPAEDSTDIQSFMYEPRK